MGQRVSRAGTVLQRSVPALTAIAVLGIALSQWRAVATRERTYVERATRSAAGATANGDRPEQTRSQTG